MKSCLLLNLVFICNLLSSLSPLHAQQYLVINEFMADNDDVLLDTTDNSFDDWIELYNSGVDDINLNGYYLTDNSSDPAKWPFPDTTIAGSTFLFIQYTDRIPTWFHTPVFLCGST